MPDMTFLLVAGTAVMLGAVVQSSVGLGLGLVAAPVVSFLDPTLMPGAMLVATAVLPMLTLATEWRHIDWRGLAWAVPGRVPGSVLGVWVVSTLDPMMLRVAVGAMVLVAVALSVRAVRARVTPSSLVCAGALSGLTGTATSIGGPPMALLYQSEEAAKVRGTLAGFFLVGVVISLAMLAAGGQLGVHEIRGGAALIPFLGAGFLAGRPLRRVVDAGLMRTALLVVVTVSGLTLIGTSFFS
ncbi:sulfite exporter TauE/SafE family protein [Nocardiopsis rhodophaea]|uniref:Probable membrane transporter protein n=1 Tax=Nocardiopsis rhodophaea TaxID=280238 RepID=A0ABN2SL03_9ACTN